MNRKEGRDSKPGPVRRLPGTRMRDEVIRSMEKIKSKKNTITDLFYGKI